MPENRQQGSDLPGYGRRGVLRASAATAVAVAAVAAGTLPARAAARRGIPHPVAPRQVERLPDGADGAEGTDGAGAPRCQAYTWGNARIDGGGFIPGIVFSRTEPGLVYVRTDIGGAYRLDRATKRWIPLTDWLGWDDWSLNGIASLASDPVEPHRVYLACGTYTNDWDPNNGAILRSADYGKTWLRTDLPFKLGGNMPGRGMAERLAIDPNRNKVLYLGAPSGHGLWRSTDRGASWAQVDAFPNTGAYADDPSDTSGYQSDPMGVLWVVFDKRSGTAGRATPVFYVGVADKDNSVYRTTDGGSTWERVTGQPTGLLPHKAVLDETSGSLYLAYSDVAGPYGGAKGAVWKLDTASGTWSDISPVATASTSFGYSGLSVDRLIPGTLMVTGYSSWWPDTLIYRSTDGGSSWKPIWEWGAYPERTLHYSLDASEDPWLTWGRGDNLPEVSPKLGWMTEALEIDPFDSGRMMYGTGATLFGTENLTDWDSGGTVAIKPVAQGIEETAVNDLISPPTGAHLLSAVSDIGGFRHSDLAVVPQMYLGPVAGSSTSLDYAGLDGNLIVRAGNSAAGELFARSTDNGVTWATVSPEPSGASGGGTVAIGADGAHVVWSPDGTGVQYLTGGAWAAASGVPSGARVEADKTEPGVFYAFSGGTFHRSTDGGATFTATPAPGLPAEGPVRFAAVPGHARELWLAGGKTGRTYGLWRSTDGGSTFTRVAAAEEADAVGFGKAAPGRAYPAVFVSARVKGTRGLFRSDDTGATWVRINDDRHQFAWTGAAVTGDPRVHGRVYVATNGRGVIYGDRA
jgi:photosystem II stability/assembly factor-like uncharacterized protein